MRFTLLLPILSLTSLSLSAPIDLNHIHNHEHKKRAPAPNFFSDIGTGIKNLVNSNATASGVLGTIEQSITNPKLTAARIKVVSSLASTSSALTAINSAAQTSGNAGVQSLVTQAQGGLTQAKDGVDRIGVALVTGGTPQKSDQKDTAIGIKQALLAINGMQAATTTPDASLSSAIQKGQTAVQDLSAGGQGVIAASGISFADLGLPDDFATSDDTGVDDTATADATATDAAAATNA